MPPTKIGQVVPEPRLSTARRMDLGSQRMTVPDSAGFEDASTMPQKNKIPHPVTLI